LAYKQNTNEEKEFITHLPQEIALGPQNLIYATIFSPIDMRRQQIYPRITTVLTFSWIF